MADDVSTTPPADAGGWTPVGLTARGEAVARGQNMLSDDLPDDPAISADVEGETTPAGESDTPDVSDPAGVPDETADDAGAAARETRES